MGKNNTNQEVKEAATATEVNTTPPVNSEETAPETVTGTAGTPKASFKPSKYEVCNTLAVRIRKQPSLEADIVKILSAGDVVTVIGETGEFYKIPSGYVHKDYLSAVKGA
jgi:uncharacterized protein YgiM (DUF1202 family)